MKKILTILFILTIVNTGIAQKHYNTKGGFIANGYDVTSYFKGKAEKGDKKFTYKYDGVQFKFAKQENLELFKANPQKYIPQYGGYCAYAVASYSGKVKINPETYEVRDGKLYLFYDFFFNNTLESWKEENPKELVKKGDENWKRIKDQK